MRAILILSLTMIFFGSELFAGGHSSTLQDVKARGKLRCVVTTGLPGFAAPDANGVWRGFDWDFCEQQLLPFLATPMLLIPLLQLVKPDSPSLMLVRVMYFGETQPSHFHVMLV